MHKSSTEYTRYISTVIVKFIFFYQNMLFLPALPDVRVLIEFSIRVVQNKIFPSSIW